MERTLARLKSGDWRYDSTCARRARQRTGSSIRGTSWTLGEENLLRENDVAPGMRIRILYGAMNSAPTLTF